MKDAIDRLVRESRPELGVREAQDVDWAKVDRGLFDRIAEEQRSERAELKAGPRRSWMLVGGIVAAAATAVLFVGKPWDGRGSVRDSSGMVGMADEAGSIVAV